MSQGVIPVPKFHDVIPIRFLRCSSGVIVIDDKINHWTNPILSENHIRSIHRAIRQEDFPVLLDSKSGLIAWLDQTGCYTLPYAKHDSR